MTTTEQLETVLADVDRLPVPPLDTAAVCLRGRRIRRRRTLAQAAVAAVVLAVLATAGAAALTTDDTDYAGAPVAERMPLWPVGGGDGPTLHVWAERVPGGYELVTGFRDDGDRRPSSVTAVPDAHEPVGRMAQQSAEPVQFLDGQYRVTTRYVGLITSAEVASVELLRGDGDRPVPANVSVDDLLPGGTVFWTPQPVLQPASLSGFVARDIDGRVVTRCSTNQCLYPD